MTPIYAGRKALLAFLVGSSLAMAALAAFVAFCIQWVFDALSGSTADAALWPVALAFVAAALGGAGLEVVRSRMAEQLGLSYVADIRKALFQSVLHASPDLLDQRGQGGLLLPFVGDLTALKKWASDGFVRLISAGAMGAVMMCVLATKNLGLAASASVVMGAATCGVLALSGPLGAAVVETRHRRGAVANFVSGSIRASRTIQAFGRFERELGRLERRNDALMASGLRLATLSGAMTSIVHLAAILMVGVTLVVGAMEIRSGDMTVGALAAALSIAGLLAGAVRDLGVAYELWRRARAAQSKIEAALALVPCVAEPERVSRIPRGEVRVSFERVGVSGLFSKVTAEARAGDVVRVSGQSGTGKSTLLALVARLQDPDQGRVRINGRNLRHAAPASVRRRVGLASARTPLLQGSVGMNLRYGWSGAPEEDVRRLVDLCGLQPVLDRLPDGMDSRLSANAPELSMGEIQRIQIARAMLGEPDVLILDDVDSHLDDETAHRIAQALAGFKGVVFVVAKSEAFRRAANVEWRFSHGHVFAVAPGARILEAQGVKS